MSSSNLHLFRPDPLMPAHAYKTYAVVQPLRTHWRPATCAEVDCPHYLNGWRTRVETLTPDLLHAAKTSGRRYTVQQVAEGETYLAFFPGQQCFAVKRHRKQLERAPLFLIRGGDHRTAAAGSTSGKQMNAQNWVDDFGEHQQRIADEIEKG